MALSLERYAYIPYKKNPLTPLLKERSKKEREKSMMIKMEEVNDLPESLMIEILSWLPVKDLLQYKSTCKSWYAIISSPDFISKHLKNYYNNNDSWRFCILALFYETPSILELQELLLDETPRILDGAVLFDCSYTHDVPMRRSFIYGPCDGLYYCYKYGALKYGRTLWNPSLNEFKSLPEIIDMPGLAPNLRYSFCEDFGFGLDLVTLDYKVVVIKRYYNTIDGETDWNIPSSVLVYSLMTNSWRYCGDLARAYMLEIHTCYMYDKGWCYWLGTCLDSTFEVIIAFDLATEASIEIDVPDYARTNNRRLAIYDGCLAFLSLRDNLDIWTFKEGCWTRKLTLGPLPHIRCPIGHWKDNCIMLQDREANLVLIDPITQELKNLAFKVGYSCQGVFAYMESLVSLKDKSKSGMHLEEVVAESDQLPDIS